MACGREGGCYGAAAAAAAAAVGSGNCDKEEALLE